MNTNENYVTIKINKSTHDLLKEYKNKHGIPINFTVDEAVNYYLNHKFLNNKKREK